HAVIQWLAVAADGDLETASNEEPLIVDDACVVGKHDAARPLALGNREILRGEIPAEARNSLVERAAARALEAKGLGILKANGRLNRLRHRILRLEALPQKTIEMRELRQPSSCDCCHVRLVELQGRHVRGGADKAAAARIFVTAERWPAGARRAAALLRRDRVGSVFRRDRW